MKNFLAASLALGAFFTLEANQVVNAVVIQPIQTPYPQGHILQAVRHYHYWGTTYSNNNNPAYGGYSSSTVPVGSSTPSSPSFSCGGASSCSSDLKLFK
ncbi:MAG: hypothetical protein K2W92_03930 [Alphaproteobacteria bacterium]|nr:hypothetical protein [Alphaproteobacteria bacterium]